MTNTLTEIAEAIREGKVKINPEPDRYFWVDHNGSRKKLDRDRITGWLMEWADKNDVAISRRDGKTIVQNCNTAETLSMCNNHLTALWQAYKEGGEEYHE